MSEREKILRFYRASGESDLAARLVDLAEGALKSRRYKVSEFLDPFGYSIAETVAAHYPRVKLESDGGYPGAERVKAAFVEEDFRGRPDFELAALAAEVDVRYYSISHRDVLGAVLALGVKREVVGDIIMGGRGCQIVCGDPGDGGVAQAGYDRGGRLRDFAQPDDGGDRGREGEGELAGRQGPRAGDQGGGCHLDARPRPGRGGGDPRPDEEGPDEYIFEKVYLREWGYADTARHP